MKSALFSIVIFSTAVFPFESAYGPRKDHLQVVAGETTYVDWTDGYISARAQAPIGDVRATGGLTRARDEATDQARETALSKLMTVVGDLPLNGRRTVRSEMEKNEELAVRMGSIQSLAFERSRRVAEGNVTVELILPFYGARGLLSRVGSGSSDIVPRMQHNNPEDEISGLLIDATDTNITPVLEPRILTDQGRLIYGATQADRSCYASRGLASFHNTHDLARKDRRTGENPYILHASSRPGASGDLIISSQDALRILGSKTGRTALKSCKVTIVLASSASKE